MGFHCFLKSILFGVEAVVDVDGLDVGPLNLLSAVGIHCLADGGHHVVGVHHPVADCADFFAGYEGGGEGGVRYAGRDGFGEDCGGK